MRGPEATVQILNLRPSCGVEQTELCVPRQVFAMVYDVLGEPLCLSHEGVQIRRNLLWALPIRAVTSLWVHDHPRPRDRRRKVVLLLLRQQAVRLPLYEKRRRGDPSQVRCVIERDQAVQRALPDAGWELEALGNHPLDERLGQPNVGGAPLDLPRELRWDRVLQSSNGRLELQHRMVIAQRSWRANQHQAGDALRLEFCRSPGDKAAPEWPTKLARSTLTASRKATTSAAKSSTA